MQLKLPLSINSDPAIVDSTGIIVLPLTWKGDTDHVRRQIRLGEYICKLINEKGGIVSK